MATDDFRVQKEGAAMTGSRKAANTLHLLQRRRAKKANRGERKSPAAEAELYRQALHIGGTVPDWMKSTRYY